MMTWSEGTTPRPRLPQAQKPTSTPTSSKMRPTNTATAETSREQPDPVHEGHARPRQPSAGPSQARITRPLAVPPCFHLGPLSQAQTGCTRSQRLTTGAVTATATVNGRRVRSPRADLGGPVGLVGLVRELPRTDHLGRWNHGRRLRWVHRRLMPSNYPSGTCTWLGSREVTDWTEDTALATREPTATRPRFAPCWKTTTLIWASSSSRRNR